MHRVAVDVRHWLTDKQFAVPVYVMTRDLLARYPGRTFTLRFGGFGSKVSASVTDPITGAKVAVAVKRLRGGQAPFRLKLTDYPRVLTIKG